LKLSPLHQRLRRVLGAVGPKELSELIGMHPETIRRYLNGTKPSAEFVSAFCRQRGIDARWLLTGDGPMRYTPAVERSEVDMDPLIAATEELLGRSRRLERAIEAEHRSGSAAGPAASGAR
jgi:hypothetical protein